jgi:uncharacterized SAM-dependent methyltransferase
MESAANVLIHASQFPDNIRRDLLASLRTRKINHKFHYDSIKQTQKWLALHQIYSPSRNDTDCAATYNRAFVEAVRKIKSKNVHVVGLGCGGGQKDTRLLKLLKSGGKKIFYTPCDVSTAMVLAARQTALSVLPDKNCFPFVCDLATTEKLLEAFRQSGSPQGASLVTFFGMIPNFEPGDILPKLAALVRQKDYLLFSANLAPGENYTAGVKKVLLQYDNAPTRDWLLTFLHDLGIKRNEGRLQFKIENGVGGLKRIAAYFVFTRAAVISIESEQFNFRRGESIRLFFSFRYRPSLIRKMLGKYGLKIFGEWVTQSEEEAVFLCRRK